MDFSVSAPDIAIADIPYLKVDCKYRTRHSHHTMMEDIKEKYCKSIDDVPVLVTKSHNQSGAYVTIPLEYFSMLLERLNGSD